MIEAIILIELALLGLYILTQWKVKKSKWPIKPNKVMPRGTSKKLAWKSPSPKSNAAYQRSYKEIFKNKKETKTIMMKVDKDLLKQSLRTADMEITNGKLYEDHPYFKLFKDLAKQIPKKKNEL